MTITTFVICKVVVRMRIIVIELLVTKEMCKKYVNGKTPKTQWQFLVSEVAFTFFECLFLHQSGFLIDRYC